MMAWEGVRGTGCGIMLLCGLHLFRLMSHASSWFVKATMAIKVYTCLKTPQMAWKKPSLLLQQVSGHWALWSLGLWERRLYILPTDYCILTYHHQFFSWYHIHRVAPVRRHCSDLHDMLPPTATSPLMFLQQKTCLTSSLDYIKL